MKDELLQGIAFAAERDQGEFEVQLSIGGKVVQVFVVSEKEYLIHLSDLMLFKSQEVAKNIRTMAESETIDQVLYCDYIHLKIHNLPSEQYFRVKIESVDGFVIL